MFVSRAAIGPILVLALLLAACDFAAFRGPYFVQPDETLARLSARPGEAVYIGLAEFVAPEDRPVSLARLSIPGLPPDVRVDSFVLDGGAAQGGGMGAVTEEAARELISQLQPLRGYVVEPGGAPVQVVVRIAAPANAPVVEFHSVSLTFLAEGRSMRGQDLPTGAKIWFCSAAPACPEPSVVPTPFTSTSSSGATAPRR